jgi:hypothetical protein
MQPGPELDKAVCEIVGITPSGLFGCDAMGDEVIVEAKTSYPPVSTAFTPYLETILEWLRPFGLEITCGGDYHSVHWWDNNDNDVEADTIQHALCLAVVAIKEERKKP